MEKNQFRAVFMRENLFLKAIFNFFWHIASYPRMIIEVFTRRDMGRQYFGIASAITVAVILALLPCFMYSMDSYEYSPFGGRRHVEVSFFGRYVTWYIYVILFIAFADQRARESYPIGNVYDTERFGFSSGKILPFFIHPPFFKKRLSNYEVEVFIEPACFFLLGFILRSCDQPIGIILIVSAIAYSFSYAAGYKYADDYFMEIINKQIMNRQIVNAFIYGKDTDEESGINFNQRPNDQHRRQKMGEQMARDLGVEDIEYEVV